MMQGMTMTLKLAVTFLAFVLMAGRPAAAADVPAPLLDAYLKVQTDLAGDQLQSAVDAAKLVASEAAKAGQSADKVRGAADKLAESKDIAAARKAFGDLSDAFIEYAGKLPGGDVKVAYCPMVKKSWLQKGDKIRNPYYGPDMGECGDFRK